MKPAYPKRLAASVYGFNIVTHDHYDPLPAHHRTRHRGHRPLRHRVRQVQLLHHAVRHGVPPDGVLAPCRRAARQVRADTEIDVQFRILALDADESRGGNRPGRPLHRPSHDAWRIEARPDIEHEQSFV